MTTALFANDSLDRLVEPSRRRGQNDRERLDRVVNQLAVAWRDFTTLPGYENQKSCVPRSLDHSNLRDIRTYVARTRLSLDPKALRVAGALGSRHRLPVKGSEAGPHREVKLTGVEFVRRYLRHVLPKGLRSVRYSGLCHPAAKAKRLRVQLLAGMPVQLAAPAATNLPKPSPPFCPHCQRPRRLLRSLRPHWRSRGPPLQLQPLPTDQATGTTPNQT